MEMKLKHRLLSMVLSLLMVLSLIPATVFAADESATAVAEVGGVKFATLADAIAAAKDGGKVRLDADITSVGAPVTVPAGVTATLDLNGHTLMVSKYTAKKDQVLVEGNLKLIDSVGTGKVCSDYTGTAGRVVSVSGSGSLQLTGGTITTEGMEKSGTAVYVAANCKFTMSGGSVYADAKRNNSAVSLANAKASMEMSGGTITAIPTADSDDDVYAISAAYSPVKISAGTVSGYPAMSVGNGSAITGGVYNGVVKAKAGTITGGMFTDVDVISLAGYVDETVYACEKQADGSYTVAKAEFTAVATITGADGVVTRYAAATEAFSALKGGDTLKLLTDIGTAAEPLPYGIVVPNGDVNVNLNAKTLIIGYDAAAAAAAGVPGYAAGVGIVNGGSGKVTVSGNGTLDVSNYTGTDGIAVWARTGSITVQSGTFINKSNEEATVYVGTNDDSSPVLKIAGGTYKNIAEGNYKYDESRTPLTFNIYNGKTADALKISAGSFYGNNDPYLGDDQVKGSILETAMTGVRKKDGYYVVAGGQGIQLLDANGGAKNCYTGASASSTGKLAVALADAADGDTLILLKNISASDQLTVTKAITIDLGDHTLTNSYAGSGYSLLTRAAVTMKNGIYTSTNGSARGIGAVADFTLENATLRAAGLVGLGCSVPDATYTVKNSTVIGNYAIANFVNNAKINIENSTITGSGVGIYHNGSYSGLQLTATDSKITAAEGKTNGIYVSGSTSTMAAAGAQQVTLTNCTVSGGTAVEVKYTDLTLTDCTVTATAETPSYTQDDNGAATTGFAVVSTDNTTGAATPAPKGKITIQGANGSYKGQVGLASLETVKTGYADFKDTTYAVSGGSFTKEVLPEYCAAGFVPAVNADGTYGVKAAPVAKIGTVEYATLAEAIAAATDGDTVTLMADINTPETSYYIQKSLTIDLGGKTLTGSGYDGVFNIEGENAAVRIKNGKIVAVEQTGTAGKYTMAVWACAAGCEVTLEDLDVSQQITHTDDKQMDMIYTSKGTIIINSGRFESGTPAWTLNCKDSAYKDGTAKIIVNGGTFVGYDPRNNKAEGEGTSFVATGVGVDAADGSFTAKAGMTAQVMDAKGASVKAFATLADAIAAATRNSTVTLLADTKENVTISTHYVTLDLNGHTLNGSTGERKPALTITARVTVKDSSAAQTGTIMREDTAENSGVSSHYVIDVQGSGWLTFESGNVKNDSGAGGTKGASLVRIGDDRVANYPGLNIKGGTFTQDNFIVIKVERGDLFLNGGSLNSANSYAVQTWRRATIKGGTVNGAVSSWTYDGGPGAETTISGGTVNGNVEAISYDGKAGKPALVSISGGTVNGTLIAGIYNSATEPTKDMATIEITGGTFSSDPTKYVIEDSAITANADGTFGVAKAYLAKVGETSYYTMDEARKAQSTSGEDIVLLRDYTTGSPFRSGISARVVDLNGYTWTCTGKDANSAAFEISNPNASLTVKNGKIVSSQLVGLIPSAMGGSIKYDNSSLMFDDVEMTTTATSGIETNGNNTNNTVTLKNSTLNVPNGFGIYFPSSGTLTLDNSTVNAKTMGVQVCAGSLSINGGSAVTVTGDAVPKAENDGAIQDGAAISVVNRTGYKGLVNVAITGGTFTAKADNAAIKAYDWANANESEFTANDKVAVSGGTFSSEVPKSCCAENYKSVANADGTYTVAEIVLTVVLNSTAGTTGTLIGGGEYTADEVANGITITAKPVGGYTFIGWYDSDDQLLTNDTKYTIPTDAKDKVTYTAKFEGNVKQKLTVYIGSGSVTAEYGSITRKWNVTQTNIPFTKGTYFTLTAKANGGFEFLYWVDKDFRIVSFDSSYSFYLGDDKTLTAVYRETESEDPYVIIRDMNDKIISSGYAYDGVFSVPEHSEFEGYKFIGWKYDDDSVCTIDNGQFTGITKSVTIFAKYEYIGGKYTVTAVGGQPDSATYAYASIAKVTANEPDEGKFFAGWYNGEILVSTEMVYSFIVTGDVTLTAKYSDEPIASAPTVNMSMGARTVDASTKNNKVVMNVAWNVPSGYTFIEGGLIRTLDNTKENSLTLENVDNNTIKKNMTKLSSASGTYSYTLTMGSVSSAKTLYAVGYIIYRNNATGAIETIYTGMNTSIPLS